MAFHESLTKKEKAFIKKHTCDMTIAEIAKSLGRSYSTIQKTIRANGVTLVRRWTEDEDKLLLEQYGVEPTWKIAMRLGVDEQRIYNRIRKLRQKEWGK